MKKLFTLMSIAAMLFVGGCDDTPVENPADDVVEIPIAQLEELCKQMNTDISALQTIARALQNGDCITDLSPIVKDGETTGYTVVFDKAEPVVITLGKSGDKEGHAPVVGLRQDDGVYCWTLDGDWLPDGDGNKIDAAGDAAPCLRITEGYWEVSCDAQTWTRLDKATGDDANLILASVEQDEDNVYFTLAYDSKIVAGKKKQIPDTYVIEFEDSIVKRICVENWDTDNDGELSYEEAEAVTTIGDKFKDSEIVSFKEFQYFTGVTTIEEEAFYGCISLTNIAVPENITEIGNDAFEVCLNLKNVYIKDIAKWCAIKFAGYRSTPLSSADNLYLNGELVTDLVIPDGFTEIGSYAFCGCYCLKSVKIPEGITKIGNNAFGSCINLTSVDIPNTVTIIGEYAFNGCFSLKSIILPETVTEIGDYAFDYCKDLENIVIPNSVISIGYRVFGDCGSLISVTVGNNIAEFGGSVFAGCNSLKSVYITDIAKWCAIKFENNDSNPLSYAHNLYLNEELVTDLEIPDDVIEIESSAFYGCYCLKSVRIPEGVVKIGDRAFSSCSSLTTIYCGIKIPLEFESNTIFYRLENCTLYVPAGCKVAYENSYYWKRAKEIVEM